MRNDFIANKDDDFHNIVLITACLIFIALVVKFQHLIIIYQEYGRLTELISRTFFKVIPFMIIFFVWTFMFSMIFYLLRSNRPDVEAFTGLPTAVGYTLLTFSNGIGNIY